MSPERAPAARTDVVLCWHMHQPEYRENADSSSPIFALAG